MRPPVDFYVAKQRLLDHDVYLGGTQGGMDKVLELLGFPVPPPALYPHNNKPMKAFAFDARMHLTQEWMDAHPLLQIPGRQYRSNYPAYAVADNATALARELCENEKAAKRLAKRDRQGSGSAIVPVDESNVGYNHAVQAWSNEAIAVVVDKEVHTYPWADVKRSKW